LCALLLLALIPSAASAQQAAFSQALSELTAAIDGTYGDEGALVRPAIDRMSAALAQWDRESKLPRQLSRIASQTPTAGLVDKRISMARMYAERGRPGDALSELDAAGRLEPRRAEIHVLRGRILEQTGRSPEALESYRTARAIEPANPVIAYYLFHKRVSAARRTQGTQPARSMQPMPGS
jgi:tetratricopeptide (TPR) repeat protein